MFYYIAHSKKPTSISNAISAISNEGARFLILCKGNYLQALLVTPKGLEETCISKLPHLITSISNFKSKQGDIIITLLANMDCLCFNIINLKLVLLIKGQLRDLEGEQIECMHLAANSKYIAASLYMGSIKIIPIKDHPFDFGEPFLIRTKYEKLIDIYTIPQTLYLSVLSQSPDTKFHLRLYYLSSLISIDEQKYIIKKFDLKDGITYHKVVMNSLDVAVILHSKGVSIISKAYTVELLSPSIVQCQVLCVEQIDESKLLYACNDGSLYLLQMNEKSEIVKLGKTCTATSIVYLDNRYAFISSLNEDSQLIRLPERKSDKLEVIKEYENISSINDLKMCNNDAYVGTGEDKSGALRKMCKGVNLNVLSILPIAHIKKVWVLNYDGYVTIVYSKLGHTGAVKIHKEQVTNSSVPIESSCETISCGAVGNQIIQVTEKYIHVISHQPTKFKHFSNIVAFQGDYYATAYLRKLTLFHNLKQISSTQLAYEISAITLKAKQVYISYWDKEIIEIYSTPDIKLQSCIEINSVCCSIVVANITGADTVYIGHIDGVLSVYDNDTKKLSQFPISSQEVKLYEYSKPDSNHIIIATDIPYVAYSQSKELTIAQINHTSIDGQW